MDNAIPIRRVALLIDSDNITLSYIEKVLKISRYHGQLEIRRAYGDWNQSPLNAQKENIKSLNIEPIQANRNGKNATDNRLLMDVGALLEYDDINIFVITSGDGDFTVACQRIQEQGKQIIGIGNKKQTSKDLQKACNQFYFLDELDAELNHLANTPKSRSEIFAQLSLAYDQVTGGANEWVFLNKLSQQLQILCPDYKSRYGGKNLAKWLQIFEKDFERKENMVRRINADSIRTLLQLIRETHPDHVCLNLILTVYAQITKSNEWVSLSTLGMALHENPTYRNRFSHRKLSEWLNVFAENFEMREGMMRKIDHHPEPMPLNIILSAYTEIAKSSKSVSLSALGMALRNNPNLNYKSHFGGKKLSTWIKSYPKRFRIDGTQVRLLD